MSDLIYVDYQEAHDDLQKVFPDAIIGDASDFVHKCRLAISGNIAETYRDYYLKLAGVDPSMLLYSLCFRMEPGKTQREIVDEVIARKNGGAS